MTNSRASGISDLLPYLRRFARALTGSQVDGDRYAVAALEAILEDGDLLQSDLPLKTALFRVMYDLEPNWTVQMDDNAPVGQQRLSALTSQERAALILFTIEEFPVPDIAHIMNIPGKDVLNCIEKARDELTAQVSGDVMIIEDESMIALDLENVVLAHGHRVTGIARTHVSAIALWHKAKPDLILADIQLADQSSGIEAVNEILSECSDVPIIFITAFPELLLTGERPEPAFVIPKPYTEAQVQSAVSQAMFFATAAGIVMGEPSNA